MNFNENNKAIYLQIADKICDDVLVMALLPESRIPSVREYAATLQVNANTVMRAYEFLERAGVIFNRRGIGFFISANARDVIVDMRRATFINDEAPYFFRRMKLLSITPDELKQMYQTYLTNNR